MQRPFGWDHSVLTPGLVNARSTVTSQRAVELFSSGRKPSVIKGIEMFVKAVRERHRYGEEVGLD